MKKNILIVEDHELTRFGLKTTFEGVDYVENIYEAESAEKAIEIFKEHPIDVIIMDLGLPNMNGIEATKEIRSANKDVKVIILTSHNDEKEVMNSLKAGANAYCSLILKGLYLSFNQWQTEQLGLTRALHILY